MVLRELAQAIRARQDFVYETTLSSHQSIELIRRARDAGYEVGLVFVALRDADLNVARVAQRVSEGGHDIPEPVIRRRYDISIRRLGDAIRLVHGVMIFDNSRISGPALLLQFSKDVIESNALDGAKPLHVLIATIVGEALGMRPDALLRASNPAVP
jgi:predicted ABC-type ATPase